MITRLTDCVKKTKKLISQDECVSSGAVSMSALVNFHSSFD